MAWTKVNQLCSGLQVWARTQGGLVTAHFWALVTPALPWGESGPSSSSTHSTSVINLTPLSFSLAGVFHAPQCYPELLPEPGPGHSVRSPFSMVWACCTPNLSCPGGAGWLQTEGVAVLGQNPPIHPLGSLWLCLAGAGQAGLLQLGVWESSNLPYQTRECDLGQGR